MKHDSGNGEGIAGLFHLGFSIAYILACLWHGKAALEHFRKMED